MYFRLPLTARKPCFCLSPRNFEVLHMLDLNSLYQAALTCVVLLLLHTTVWSYSVGWNDALLLIPSCRMNVGTLNAVLRLQGSASWYQAHGALAPRSILHSKYVVVGSVHLDGCPVSRTSVETPRETARTCSLSSYHARLTVLAINNK